MGGQYKYLYEGRFVTHSGRPVSGVEYFLSEALVPQGSVITEAYYGDEDYCGDQVEDYFYIEDANKGPWVDPYRYSYGGEPKKAGIISVCDWVTPEGELAQRAKVGIKEAVNPKPTIKKGENKMNTNNMLGRLNLEMGAVDDKRVAFSMNGVAVGDGRTFTAYSADGQATDVTDFVIPEAPLFKMPVAIKKIKIGDLIVHRDAYMHVKKVRDDGSIVAINMLEAKEETIIPIKNIFGFNYYVKIASPFGSMASDADEANPFGKMLPLMMFSGMGGNDGGGMNPMFLMLMMQGGDGDGLNFDFEGGDFGPMLPFMLMSNNSGNSGGSDMMQTLLLMQMMKGFGE